MQRRLSVEFVSEKDEMQAKLIKTESKLITLESDMKNLKVEYENKIITLESTIAAKNIHIKQLVQFTFGWWNLPLHACVLCSMNASSTY